MRVPLQDTVPEAGGQDTIVSSMESTVCVRGVDVSEHLSLRRVGKTTWESYGRQPDSGKQTVRDDMGGLRNRGSKESD